MDKMSAADALNNQNTDDLISAITSAIQNEIQNSKETFNIDSIAYTISEIASGIQIKLPTDISLNDNETGEITGVVLNYNNISLTPKNSSSSSFTVVGFLPTSSTQTGYNPGGQGSSTNRNHQIASKLDSYLSQIINVSKQDNMSSMSAADALNNQTSDNLKQAITAAIQNEIGSEQFNIDGIAYTAAEIASSIQIGLPTSISLTAAENGQIPNVTLSYNNISLKANNGQSTFIIEGFEQNTIDQINKIIANTLGSYIKNPIVLTNNFAYTVLDCLSNTTDAQTLTTAIMSAIGNELSSSTNLIINSIQLN
ncbi:hypothetical protein J6W34_08950 [bacterium]|nr:hypothetical protein [bacterium]